MEVAGKAYNPRNHKWLAVSLSLTGTTTGSTSRTMMLHVSGGSFKVMTYTFPVSKGYGTLVQRCHYITFTLKLSPTYYGGCTVIWYLRGKTGTLVGNTVPVSFYSYRVMLPMSGCPRLYYMTLRGTLALSYINGIP